MVAYIVIITVLLFVVILGSRVAERDCARRNMERCGVSTREEMALDAIFANHYAQDGLDFERFSQAWRIISNRSDIPVGKMRPSDRIEVELSHARDEIGWMIWELLVLPKHMRQDEIHVACVDDLVRLLCAMM